MSVMRLVILGAVGFGIGGAIGGFIVFHLPGLGAFLLGPLVGGAVGGASLGLALKAFRPVVVLAVLGALGLTIGVIAGLMLGSFFNYSEVAIAAMVGTVVGASLGAAFLDWRTIPALAVTGAVGFGIGLPAGHFLWASFPVLRQKGEEGSYAVAGLVGGALLGAVLRYLEERKLAAEQRPRVR
jgi:hypothetical protein